MVEKFRAAKTEPEGYVLYAYAAMQLFEQAATAAKAPSTPTSRRRCAAAASRP